MHIKQNDKRLYNDIQKVGCFFRSALLLAEIKTGKELDFHTINKLWRRCLGFGFIDKNLNVVNSARISTLALRELGDDGYFSEVATFVNGHLGWYNGVEHRAEYFIQKIEQNGPSKYHFRVVDNYGDVIEDPHEPAIKCQGVCYSIVYKYDEL
jgi:hypothetical protein